MSFPKTWLRKAFDSPCCCDCRTPSSLRSNQLLRGNLQGKKIRMVIGTEKLPFKGVHYRITNVDSFCKQIHFAFLKIYCSLGEATCWSHVLKPRVLRRKRCFRDIGTAKNNTVFFDDNARVIYTKRSKFVKKNEYARYTLVWKKGKNLERLITATSQARF